MTAADIAKRLHGKLSRHGWMAQCPAHKDHNPSLHITQQGDRVLLKCFAGCDQRSVIAALRACGLWPDCPRGGHPANWGSMVRTYDYTDEHGTLLYQVCRFHPKSFRPRRPDGVGGWHWGYGNVRRVLYRLPEVIEAPIVLLAEGEKDVDSLREKGFIATTNAGGANGWRDDYAEYLRGRECIIVPDADKPGLGWARTVAQSLLAKAVRICVVTVLPDLKGKDISDWFTEGHSELEFITLLERDLPHEALGSGNQSGGRHRAA